jgi:hypothetical protein
VNNLKLSRQTGSANPGWLQRCVRPLGIATRLNWRRGRELNSRHVCACGRLSDATGLSQHPSPSTAPSFRSEQNKRGTARKCRPAALKKLNNRSSSSDVLGLCFAAAPAWSREQIGIYGESNIISTGKISRRTKRPNDQELSHSRERDVDKSGGVR